MKKIISNNIKWGPITLIPDDIFSSIWPREQSYIYEGHSINKRKFFNKAEPIYIQESFHK